jgi:hypothetical protein
MRIVITLILITFGISAWAEEPMGRLFSTPAERTALDQVRKTKKEMIPQKVETTEISAKPITAVLPDAVTVQGYVKRTDGKKSTIWINHEAIQEGDSNDEVVVGKLPAKTNRVPIRIKANGKQFALKAGQVYDPETNMVREMRASAHGDAASGDNVSGTISDTN